MKEQLELTQTYLNMDAVGGCSEEQWQIFMAAESAQPQMTDPLSEEELLIRELMARHLSRGANALSFIANITQITLPY